MGIGPLSLAVKRPVRDTDVFIPLYAFCGVYRDKFVTATASIRVGAVVLAMLVFLLCCHVTIQNSTAQCINRNKQCCSVLLSRRYQLFTNYCHGRTRVPVVPSANASCQAVMNRDLPKAKVQYSD